MSQTAATGITALPSLKGLRALSRLAKTGSLSAAADDLGVTRSALSHRLADLEAQLGVALTRKVGRRTLPTDDAEALLAAMGDALERIEAAVGPLQRRRAQLRLSTVATFASNWLIPRLPALHARHPALEIAIATTTRPIDFASEDVDCAIRHGLGAWDGLSAALLFRETLVAVAAPRVVDGLRRVRAASPVDGASLIRARSRFLDWPVFWRNAGWPGRPPEGGLLVETRAQALEAALAGAGVALTDGAYVEALVDQARLCRVAPARIELAEGYYFVHRPGGRNGRAIADLRDWLLDASAPFRIKQAS